MLLMRQHMLSLHMLLMRQVKRNGLAWNWIPQTWCGVTGCPSLVGLRAAYNV
jgi:hypothetical protein